MKLGAFSLLGVVVLVSCVSTQNAVVNPAAVLPSEPLTAYVEKVGGRSADVDAHVERALISNGIGVTADRAASNILVKHTDDWKWDLVMYLRALDVQMYDSHSGTLIGSARYSNASLTHSYPNVGKIADELIAKILTKAKRTASK